MDMPFKFRDYAVHLFPGLIFLVGVYEISPEFQSQLKANPVSGVIVVIIIGYFIGFVSDAIAHSFTRRVIRKIGKFKDPFKSEWERIKKENDSLHSLAISLLKKEVGEGVVEKEKPNRLIYYCLRVIENEASAQLANLPNRIISLENITINIMPPLLFLSVILLVKGELYTAILPAIAFITMPYRNIQYRRWLMRVILASYVVIRKNAAG